MTLRLTEDEQAALRERAEAEGISMQEAARRAVREYVVHGRHRDRVSATARRVMDVPRPSDASVSDAEVEYLDVEDLVDLARLLLGHPPPIRDMGLLGSAAARPPTMVFGEDAYPDMWTKAAALLQSVVKNHPLIDGNKRLGWLSTAVFLELNGVATHRASNDDVYELVIGIAAGAHTIEQIAGGLQLLVR
jgi:death on curing protein